MSTFEMISVSAGTNEVKPWKVVDVKGAKYLTRDDVYQRFKLSKNINVSNINDINKKIVESGKNNEMYTLPLDNVNIHLNGKNMNPYLISKNSDINTIILTIEKGYELIKYEVSGSITIPCTFRQKGLCGCLLNYKGIEDNDIINLVLAKEEYMYDVTYHFYKGSIVHTIKKRKEKRADERAIGFKAKLIKPITFNYICHKDKFEELTNKLNKFGVTEFTVATFDGTEESLNAALEEVYVNNSRAVTVYGLPYGMRINPDKMKEYRMQYVFILTKTKGIITVKSN